MTMSLREGTIETIDGDFAVIVKRSGRRERVALKRLHGPNQRSQISEFVEILVEANREAAE